MKRAVLVAAAISVGVTLSTVIVLLTVQRTAAADATKAKPGTKAGNRFLGLPPLMCPPDNAISQEKIALGRKLFFERALSSDSTRSCATCHVPYLGFSDSDRFSLGVEGQRGTRHSLTILNSAFHQSLMWDGRGESLEHQAMLPLGTKHEMAMSHQMIVNALKTQGLEPEFKKVFGGGITPHRVASALACFERTLVAGDSPYDRFRYLNIKSALTDEQKRGMRVFEKSGCATCHSNNENAKWTLFTDHKFHNIGVGTEKEKPDVGRYALTHADADWAAFRTPSLRNVGIRAPYFHDGSAKTLTEAVDYHLSGGTKNKNLDRAMKSIALTDQEKDDLVAFLNALTSSDIDVVVNQAIHGIKQH